MKIKNGTKIYFIIWIIAIIVFHLLMFSLKTIVLDERVITTKEMFSYYFSDDNAYYKAVATNFFISYIFILLSFISQLVCSFIFLQQKTSTESIYHYPIFVISLQGLIVTIIFSILFIFIPIYPLASASVFIILLAITLSRSILAKGTANKVMAVGKNIAMKTQFIKLLSNEVEKVLNVVGNDDENRIIKDLHEKIKFSDPVSVPVAKDIEEKIVNEISAISDLIGSGKASELEKRASDIKNLIDERNNLIKMNK